MYAYDKAKVEEVTSLTDTLSIVQPLIAREYAHLNLAGKGADLRALNIREGFKRNMNVILGVDKQAKYLSYKVNKIALKPVEPVTTIFGEIEREIKLETIRGIGPAKAEKLKIAGISTIKEFIDTEDDKLKEVLGDLDIKEMKKEARLLSEGRPI